VSSSDSCSFTVVCVCDLSGVVPAEVKPGSVEPCCRPAQPDESKPAASSCMDVGQLSLSVHCLYC